MGIMLTLRNSQGHAQCVVSRQMARQLISRYMGEWKDNSEGQSLYIFREAATYGNNDIGILIFPGSYINVEDY